MLTCWLQHGFKSEDAAINHCFYSSRHSIKLMPLFLTLWGLLAGESPHLKLRELIILCLRNPKGRFDIVFRLGAIPINICTFSQPLNPHLKLLALIVREPHGNILHCFSLPINKCNFLPPLTGGFRGDPSPDPAATHFGDVGGWSLQSVGWSLQSVGWSLQSVG